jgi:hypothetical protein
VVSPVARAPDWSSQDRRNRRLGLAGEEFVVDYERSALANAGRADLAERIRHVARDEGDGAGYDVLSFTPDGTPKHIEVKTTAGPAETEFILSSNELRFSQEHADSYHLYRVFELDIQARIGRLYVVPGSLDGSFTLRPIEFKARR